MQLKGLMLLVAALLPINLPGDYGTLAASAHAQNTSFYNTQVKVRTDLCTAEENFAIAVHGGAVFEKGDYEIKLDHVHLVLKEARTLLAAGARGIEVIEAVIASMENSGIFNAGKGSFPNEEGKVEMDASIMDGSHQRAGAVASVETVRNPISAARLVMDKSRHVMLAGPDADSFVEQNGGEMIDDSYFRYGRQDFSNVPLPSNIVITPPGDDVSPVRTEFSGAWGGVAYGSLNFVLIVEEITSESAKVIWALGPHPYTGEGQYRRLSADFVDEGIQLTEADGMGGKTLTYQLNPDGVIRLTTKSPGEAAEEHQMHRISIPGTHRDGGTVGAVVRDRCGDLAAGTSTGGLEFKTPGRIGSSPIIGAGTYANNETAAISATGEGEFLMKHVVVYDIAAAMKYAGLTLNEAATNAINVELVSGGGRGGVIAVDKEGNISMPFNTVGMVRGRASDTLAPTVSVY